MKDKINPKLEEGDRIVLIMMPGETDISYGDKGTVSKVNNVHSFIQYFVDWDNSILKKDLNRKKQKEFVYKKNEENFKHEIVCLKFCVNEYVKSYLNLKSDIY